MNSVGTMFSFDDPRGGGGSSGSGGGGEDDSDSDAEFESFVTQQPPKTVHAVPNYGEPAGKGFNYSDPRLKQYEGMKGLGSDTLNAPPAGAEPVIHFVLIE